MKTLLIAGILFTFSLVGCISRNYEITVTSDGFKSNKVLWSLAISELQVDSLNAKGFPAAYSIIGKIDAHQKGDHIEDNDLKKIAEKEGREWKVKKYGYLWEPQKYISFKEVNKYYDWWSWDSSYVQYDTLPFKFMKSHWYLFTNWQDGSTGGGRYSLFVFVNEDGEFIKYFDIQEGPW